ncbi:MAG: uroporphyrinogen decarboxylase family protein [Oscillospiraceae bacterium]
MDKRQRMKAAFNNQQVDFVPAGFWHHYTSSDIHELVEQQVDFYRATDMDFLKIMYEFMFELPEKVTKSSDWYKIKPLGKNSPQYIRQTEIIKGILDKTNGEAMAFTTMFNAMKMAAWCVGDEAMMVHARENPEALSAGIAAFSETLVEWVDGFIDAGVDGIFYSAQFGEVGRFNAKEWNRLVKPYDIEVLKSIKARDKYIILHLCGEPEYDFKVHIDRYKDYPMDMINWAVHANNYEIERGIDFFGCPVMGGLDNRGLMLTGTRDDIDKAVSDIVTRFGAKGFALGADCSIQGNYDVDLITYTIKKAHSIQMEG